MSVFTLLCGVYVLLTVAVIIIILHETTTPTSTLRKRLQKEGINRIVVLNTREYFGYSPRDLMVIERIFYVHNRTISKVPQTLRFDILEALQNSSPSHVRIEKSGGSIFVRTSKQNLCNSKKVAI